MKITYSHYLVEHGQNIFKISDDEIELTINDPSSKKVLKALGGQNRILFLRRVENGTHILVDGLWNIKTGVLDVRAAFRLFDDFIAEVHSNDPLMVLQNLVMKFGMVMQVGEQHNKFIYQSVFEVSPQTKEYEILKILGTKKGRNYLYAYGHHRVPNSNLIEISLAYAIDSAQYAEWLKERMADWEDSQK